MSKMIILPTSGRKVSEDTILMALKEHCGFEKKKEKYILQAGDVVIAGNECKRIIVKVKAESFPNAIVAGAGDTDDVLVSINRDGRWMAYGQEAFDQHGYERIGRLNDILKW